MRHVRIIEARINTVCLYYFLNIESHQEVTIKNMSYSGIQRKGIEFVCSYDTLGILEVERTF